MSTTLVCARYNEDINWLLPLCNESIIIYNKGEDNLNIFPNEKIIKLPNLGREGGTYIKHIIDNYDKLSDYTIFIQGNPVDHIYPGNPSASYQNVIDHYYEHKNYNFKFISTWLVHVNKREVKEYSSGIGSLGVPFTDFLEVKKIIEFLPNFYNESEHRMNDINNLKYYLHNFKDLILIFELSDILRKYSSFNLEDIEKFYTLFNTSILEEALGDHYHYGSGALFIASRDAILRRPKHFYEDIYNTLQAIHPEAGYGLEKFWKLILD